MPPTPLRSPSPLLLAAFSIAALLASGVMISCRNPVTDVGRECLLVKRGPPPAGSDGGYTLQNIHESELPAGWDFISFGSTECEDFVCIRDRDMPRRATVENPDPLAVGYCSRPCALSTSAGCTVYPGTRTPEKTDMSSVTCRAMLLDDTTVTTFCEVEPQRCRELFGTNRSPYFCARGGTSDGGTRADGGTP